MDRDYTLDDVRDALRYLDESDRDTWVRIGMAVKAEFGDAGFDAWDDWSQGYGKYQPRIAKQTWKSFRSGGISLGTLIHEAREKGWQPRIMDAAEQQRLAVEAAERRKRAAEQAKAEDEHDAKLADAAAALAERLWLNASTTGMSPYLGKKQVRAHRVGFYNEPVVAEINTDTCEHKLIIGWGGETGCKAYLDEANQRDADTDPRSFKFLKRGTLAVPMRDASGQLRNIQFIFSSGKKTFIKGGQKSKTCHVVGVPALWRMGDELGDVVCIAEGYATAASIYEATGYPVAVAWDCGNLRHVAEMLRGRYPQVLVLVCADDDRDTDGNPGMARAAEAAERVGGFVAVPDFNREAAA